MKGGFRSFLHNHDSLSPMLVVFLPSTYHEREVSDLFFTTMTANFPGNISNKAVKILCNV